MKIAIFGGSFNPIHNAHIKLAQRFVDEIGLDLVYFVPTHITPLKDNRSIISSQQRLDMCKIALKDNESFLVSDVEIKREGMSYSCDTIAYFKSVHPDDKLYFIMGADMFLTLEKWHNFEYIFENVTILTAPRDGYDYDDLCKVSSDYQKYSCKAYITKEYIEDLSSTMLRDMIKENMDISEYIDADVFAYINENNIYR